MKIIKKILVLLIISFSKYAVFCMDNILQERNLSSILLNRAQLDNINYAFNEYYISLKNKEIPLTTNEMLINIEYFKDILLIKLKACFFFKTQMAVYEQQQYSLIMQRYEQQKLLNKKKYEYHKLLKNNRLAMNYWDNIQSIEYNIRQKETCDVSDLYEYLYESYVEVMDDFNKKIAKVQPKYEETCEIFMQDSIGLNNYIASASNDIKRFRTACINLKLDINKLEQEISVENYNIENIIKQQNKEQAIFSKPTEDSQSTTIRIPTIPEDETSEALYNYSARNRNISMVDKTEYFSESDNQFVLFD